MSATCALTPEERGPTITIGEILVEILATTRGDGFQRPQPLLGPFPSGAPAIFIDQVARFGGRGGIIGSVGDDDFGRLNIARLSEDGVDVSAVQTIFDKPTGSAFVRYRADGDRDFVFNVTHSAAGYTQITPAARLLIGRAGHLHVMGSAMTIPAIARLVSRALETVRTRGGSISFDPNLRKELLHGEETRRLIDTVLAATDVLLPSGDELTVVAAEKTEQAAVKKLLDSGIAEIVLKRGRDGATHFSRMFGRIDCAAFRVSSVDPTGAGDCFGAAYVTARRQGMDPATALQYANAAGAMATTQQGPMEGASTRARLEELIAESSGRS